MLAGTASNLAVARSLLAISALLLLVLTVAALLAVARLLATQREAETALLNARGATRWQLTRLTAAEVIPLCGTAALAGGAAGVWLARLLGGTLYRGGAAAGGVRASGVNVAATATWLDALAAMLAVAVLAIGAMLFPVLRPAPAARVRRGRQAAIAGATRAGADLGLVVLAVLAVLAAAPVLRRLDDRERYHGEHRPGARPGPGARAGRRHGRHAAAAARRGAGHGPAVPRAGASSPRPWPAGSSAGSRCARAAPRCCS